MNLKITTVESLEEHECGKCSRMFPQSNYVEGCAKVIDYNNWIEKYPWIRSGYETFRTKYNKLVVSECSKCMKKNFRDQDKTISNLVKSCSENSVSCENDFDILFAGISDMLLNGDIPDMLSL